MKSFETQAGKKIELFLDNKSQLIKVKFVPGGQLPEALTSGFTSEIKATEAVNKYLAETTKQPKAA